MVVVAKMFVEIMKLMVVKVTDVMVKSTDFLFHHFVGAMRQLVVSEMKKLGGVKVQRWLVNDRGQVSVATLKALIFPH